MHKNYYYKSHTNFDTIDEIIEVIEKFPVTYEKAEPRYRDEDFGFKITNDHGDTAYLHGTTSFTSATIKKPFVSMTWDNPAGSRKRGSSSLGVEDLEECLQKLVDGTWDEVEPWEKFANDYYDKITRAHSRESLVKDFSKKFIEDEGGACTSASCGCGTGAQTSGGLQAFAPENAVVAGGRNLFVGGVRREKALNIRNTPTGNVKTGGNVEYKRKKQYRNKAFGESLVQQFVRTHLSEDADSAGDRIILTYTAYANWRNDVLPDGDFLSVFDDGILWNNSRNATNWANACDAIGSAPGDDELADYIDEKYHPNAAKAVKKITMEFDKQNEQLLVAVKLNTKATDVIVKEVTDYVNGQMSDGWGEGFEQTPVFDAQIYAVYNDYDIDLYTNERDAERALTKLQYEQENEYDDEDNNDHSSDYVMDELNVELFYSFYKHGVKLPAKVEVQ